MGEILVDQRGKVLVVTIANERKRNALDVSMEKPFHDALVAAENDDGIRAVVITGAGDIAFCSGHDLSEVGRPGVKFMKPDPMGYPDLMRKPVIAAVNGHCHAAGLMMALCCDLRIASENAVFGQPGARLGQLPMGGQIWRLPQAMPRVRALEMLLTARHMSGADAFEWGLVSKLVKKGEALAVAMELAEAIADNSPNAVQAIKAGLKLYEKDGRDAFNHYEAETMRGLMDSSDRIEGSKAFMEKRAPTFR
ncbi:enoyl-CoA hydratase/isomerase family protein [Mesorhizobium sp. CAU 1732]|uniref:enoyl-CoA hydratase/isomerase family protein n=1 Tax=Mesorhizobium sp. CAU 1732 TaxID=3140358 RepID=UPI003261D29D